MQRGIGNITSNDNRYHLVQGITDRYLTNIDSLPSERRRNREYNDALLRPYGDPERERVMQRAAKDAQRTFSQRTYMRGREASTRPRNEQYQKGYMGKGLTLSSQ